MLGSQLVSQITRGRLTLIQPDGSKSSSGTGPPEVTIRISDWGGMLRLALNPSLAAGELYMDGRLIVERGDIADLLELAFANPLPRKPALLSGVTNALRRLWAPFASRNSLARSRRNVAHHYDLSGRLYDLFLDRDRQYSCAYFATPKQSLEAAQEAKKRHIAAKLLLDRPGLRVLDIGCGWGGLALDLARNADANVLGATLSEEQFRQARQRAEEAQLAHACRFALIDYRDIQDKFDRIVSVGMFEHVGAPQQGGYFHKIAKLLNDDGVALIHTIGRPEAPGPDSTWIRKHIFPGGHVPALSEIVEAVERSGLIITDVEVLRLHYAQTLREWRRRFMSQKEEAARLYDERFCRMWEFYLASCEMAFRAGRLVVFQVQLAKRIDALPLTRDYMFEAERASPFLDHAASPTAADAASIR